MAKVLKFQLHYWVFSHLILMETSCLSFILWNWISALSCHFIWTGNCPCSSVQPSVLRSLPCQHPVSPNAASKTPSAASYTGYSLLGFMDTLLAGTCHLSVWALDITTIPLTSPVPPVGQANPVYTWPTNRFNNSLQVHFLFHSRPPSKWEHQGSLRKGPECPPCWVVLPFRQEQH